MFEQATRAKMRFPYRGMVSVEDLWDIKVEDLDSIFKQLNSQVKVANEESLLTTKSPEDEVLSVKTEIVKHIVSVKLAEAEARKLAKTRKEEKQKILAIISEKQDQALQGKTVAELTAMLEALD
jgi:hypothetical protein